MKRNLLKIKKLRKTKVFNISIAESCTGGMISSYLTSIDGSSSYFDGSVVSYSNDFKCRLLGVRKKTIEKYGAVSHETALAMVKGLSKKRKNEILISVTGVAGPKGGTAKTPVGCVFFGIGTKIKNKYIFSTVRKMFRENTRKHIQLRSTEFAIKQIIKEINKI